MLDEGGGAFYGPKISVQARDAIGRTWQMSTIQLDFQLPQRFELEYVGADNERHRPIMIHRALFGSVERFFAILARALRRAPSRPGWRRCRCGSLPVADDHEDYAAEVVDRAAGRRSRVELRRRADEPLGARIRKAKLEKLPYVLVVGDDDVEHRTVGVNARGSDAPERGVALDDFVARLSAPTSTLTCTCECARACTKHSQGGLGEPWDVSWCTRERERADEHSHGGLGEPWTCHGARVKRERADEHSHGGLGEPRTSFMVEA